MLTGSRGGCADLVIWIVLFVARSSVALDSATCTAVAPQVPPVEHSLMQTARRSPQLIMGRGAGPSPAITAPEVRGKELLPDWWRNVTSPTEMDSVVRRAIRDGQAPMIQKLAEMITATIQWAQKQMLESARADKAKGDEILAAAHAEMTMCASRLNQVAVLAANDSYQAAGAAHRQCRQAESELSVLNQGLLAELTITVSAEDAECAGLDELNETAEDVLPGESPDDVEKIRRAHVLREELSLQTTRCEGARRANADKQKAFSDAGSECLRRTSVCDVAQDKLELAACARAAEVQGQCLNYTQCYGTSKDTYNALAATHKEWVDGRKAEWTLSRQIECVVELLGKGIVSVNGDDEDWLFEDCKARHQTDAALEFGVNTREAPGAEACGIVGDLYPCTEAYLAKEYAGLPKDAPGKTCVTCAALSSRENDANQASQQLPSAASPSAADVAPALMPVPARSADAAEMASALPTEAKAPNITSSDGSQGNATGLDFQASGATPDEATQRNSTQATPINPASAAVDDDALIPGNDTESNNTRGNAIDAFDIGDDELQPDDGNKLVQASTWADGLRDAAEEEDWRLQAST